MDSSLARKLGPAIEQGVNDSPPGEYALYTPNSRTLVTIARGHLALPFSHAIERVRGRLATYVSDVLVFHDWEEASSYDHQFRANNQRSAAAIADRIAGIHVLSQRNIVSMGVSTVSLALAVQNPIVITSIYERAAFEDMLRDAL